jgi:hypothetical protein
MISYRSPELCARCGSRDISTTWKVRQTTSETSALSFITLWLGYYVFRNESFAFDIPICRTCQGKLERIQKITRRITIFLAVLFGLVLGSVYWVKAVRGNALLAGIAALLLIIVIGALIGGFVGLVCGLVIKEGTNYEFCGYDGKYVEIKNKVFRREFASLNPSLVKQKKK